MSGFGRVLVPINFRLNAEEISYIVEHSGASMLLVDPELDDSLRGVDAKHRLRARRRGRCRAATASIVEPEPWRAPDEDDTATINYTSGTTARPKGVQMTHRNIWVNADDVRLAGGRQRPGRATSTRCRCSTATAGA